MYKYNHKLIIQKIPFLIWKQLVNELEKNSNWIKLAKHVAKIGSLGFVMVKI